jgi:WD40 repeat protein
VPFPNTTIYSLAFTADGSHLVVAGSTQDRLTRDQPIVRVWALDSEREVATLKQDGEIGRHVRVAVSPDGKSVAAAGLVVVDGKVRGNVRVWDLESGKSRWSGSPERQVNCIAWSRDSARLAAGDASGTITLWSADGGPTESIPDAHRLDSLSGVVCMTWSHDGKRIASAGIVGTVRIWTVADRREAAALETEGGIPSALAFAPDDRSLFICGRATDDVQLWDFGPEPPRVLSHLPGLPIGGFALEPGGQSYITVVHNGLEFHHAARGWDVATGQQLWFASVPTEHINITTLPYAVAWNTKRLALANSVREANSTHWSVTLFDLPP